MTINIEVTWADEIVEKLRKLGENDLKNARKKWLRESALFLQWEAKNESPVKSWLLRKSIQYDVRSDYATVFTGLYYAPFVHNWTKAHVIKPGIRKALYWSNDNSKWIFSKKVNHPWSKAHPFFTRAVEKNEKKIVDRFYSIISSYLND